MEMVNGMVCGGHTYGAPTGGMKGWLLGPVCLGTWQNWHSLCRTSGVCHPKKELMMFTKQSDYLLKAMQLYPKKEFVKDPDGTWVQCISETWTGKNLWKLWVMILHNRNS